LQTKNQPFVLGYIIFTLEILVVIVLAYFRYYNPSPDGFLARYTEISVLIRFMFFLGMVDLGRRIIQFSYARKQKIKRYQKNNFQYGIDNIAKLLVGLGFIVSIFALFGVDLKSLITSMSIVAAAIAIITKDYITDFIVGIYFSFSRNFEINDYVKTGEMKGKIIELQMLKIKILNDDDDTVLVPNAKVYNNEIINYTKRDIRLMSIDFQISISSVERLEILEKDLIDSLTDYYEFLETNSFNLRIVEMKKDYIDLKFQYSLKKLDRDLQQQIRRKTVRRVFNHISEKLSSRKEGDKI
jgi:MscS family membrane protein